MFERQTLHGAYFALSAYLFWGVVPIYFKWIGHVGPLEIVSHRIIWSVVLLILILCYMRRLDVLVLPRQHWWKVGCSALLLSLNWLIFVYAILDNRIVEASLGYFINPLVSVFLGMVFLGERLRPLQWIAISIAAAGILFQLVWYGKVPAIALGIAVSFGVYGLMRKNLGLHSVGGLALETIILAPVALVYLGWQFQAGALSFGHSGSGTDMLLIASGLVTSFPLLCFAAAVKRLSLTATGLFQYLSPSLSLAIAVLVFGEPFGEGRIITFTCIWIALALFAAETLYHHRRRRPRHLDVL